MSRSKLLIRNILATLVTQILSWGLTFSVTLFLPRYLGANGLGQLAFATSLVTVLGVVVSLGTSTVLVKEIARDRSRAGELMIASLLLRLIIGLVVTGIAVGAVTVLHYPVIIRLLVLATALAMVMSALNDVFYAALQGQENLPRQSVGMLVEKCCSCVITIILIFAHAPIWTIAGVGIVSNALSLVVNLSAFREHAPALRFPTSQTIRAITISGLPFISYLIFRQLYGSTDPVILNVLTNDATVGWYSAACRLIGTTLVIPVAFGTALFPTLVRLHSEDVNEFKQLASRAFSLVMLCAMPITLVFLCVPDRLIGLMHYPKEFAACSPALRVGSLAVLLNYAGCLLGPMVMAADAQTKMARTSVYACFIGIPACIAGTYFGHHIWGNGAVGAMISDILLEGYLVATYVQMLPSGTFNLGTLSLVSRYLLAGLLAAAGLVLVASTQVGLWSIAPFVVVYLALCWMLRCFDPAQMALLRRIVARKIEA